MIRLKKRTIKIFIIGAGAAGLSSGLSLKKLSSTKLRKDVELKITFLEARNRVGGRCHTKTFFKKFPVDLGACWIEGVKNNPLTKLCNDFKHTLTRCEGGYTLHDFDGSVITNSEVKKSSLKFYTAFNRAKRYLKKNLHKNDDKPLDIGISKFFEKDSNELSKKDLRIINYVASGIEQFNGGTFKEMSGLNYGTGPDLKGGEAYVREGIGALFEKLAKREKFDIKYEHIVKSIDYEKKPIRILTNKDTFECDYCICTVPLGVLKSSKIKFVPNLPLKKTESIKKLGFGLMNKLVLEFPKKFWKDGSHGRFGFAHEEIRSKFRWWGSLNAYFPNEKELPVLICILTCDFAYDMEKQTKENVVNEAMIVLRKIFKDKKIPDPSKYDLSYWNKDQWVDIHSLKLVRLTLIV